MSTSSSELSLERYLVLSGKGNRRHCSYLIRHGEVSVNGERVDGDQVSFVGQMLVFSEEPDELAMIDVRYREAIDMLDSFTLNSVPIPNTVTVVSAALGEVESSYNPLTKAITILEEIPDGDKLGVTFEETRHRQLRYPINGIEIADIEQFTLVDLETGEVINGEIEGDMLVVDPSDFRQGRKVRATFDRRYRQEDRTFFIPVASDVIPGSLEILGDGLPENCQESIEIDESGIRFVCGNDNIKTISVRFSIENDFTNEFVLEDADLLPDQGIKVLVDHEEILDYAIEGNRVILDKATLMPGSTVTIIVGPIP